MEWISVKDRLPQEKLFNGLVCLENDAVLEAHYSNLSTKGFWSLLHGQFREDNKVTHWMPLPKPPTK